MAVAVGKGPCSASVDRDIGDEGRVHRALDQTPRKCHPALDLDAVGIDNDHHLVQRVAEDPRELMGAVL